MKARRRIRFAFSVAIGATLLWIPSVSAATEGTPSASLWQTCIRLVNRVPSVLALPAKKVTARRLSREWNGKTLELDSGKRVKMKTSVDLDTVNISIVDESGREVAHGHRYVDPESGKLGAGSIYVNEAYFREGLVDFFEAFIEIPAQKVLGADVHLIPTFAEGSFELTRVEIRDPKGQIQADFDVKDGVAGAIHYTDPASDFAQNFGPFAESRLPSRLQNLTQDHGFLREKQKLLETPPGWMGQGIAKAAYKLYADTVPRGTTLQLIISNKESLDLLRAKVQAAGGKKLSEEAYRTVIRQNFADTKWGHILKDTAWELNWVAPRGKEQGHIEVELIRR